MEAHTSQQLLTAISEASGIPVSDIREGMSTEELGLDSLDVLELLNTLDIPHQAVDELRTVGDIAAYISKRKVG